MRPLPYTMALGAVATGIINAQLALIAAGIINTIGSTPIAADALANTGISNVAVAVLEVISVTKLTARHNNNNVNTTGNADKPVKASPSS